MIRAGPVEVEAREPRQTFDEGTSVVSEIDVSEKCRGRGRLHTADGSRRSLLALGARKKRDRKKLKGNHSPASIYQGISNYRGAAHGNPSRHQIR